MSLIIYQNVFAVVYYVANMRPCAAGCLFATQWIKEILSTSVAVEYHLTINRATCMGVTMSSTVCSLFCKLSL